MQKAMMGMHAAFTLSDASLELCAANTPEDRKSVVQGKSVDLGGRRIIKKKKKKENKKIKKNK